MKTIELEGRALDYWYLRALGWDSYGAAQNGANDMPSSSGNDARAQVMKSVIQSRFGEEVPDEAH